MGIIATIVQSALALGPIDAAAQALPIIERDGVVGVLALSAALIGFGEAAAIIVLWKAWQSLTKVFIETRDSHYRQMIEMALKFAELDHKLAESLAGHTEAIRSIRETMRETRDSAKSMRDTMQSLRDTIVVVSERVGHV